MSALDTTGPALDHDGIHTGVTTVYAAHYETGHKLYAESGTERVYLGTVCRDGYERANFHDGKAHGTRAYELPHIPNGWRIEAVAPKRFVDALVRHDDAPEPDEFDPDLAEAEAERHFAWASR